MFRGNLHLFKWRSIFYSPVPLKAAIRLHKIIYIMIVIENELVDYYKSFCELNIWFNKIIVLTNKHTLISLRDILHDFIVERNRILTHVPVSQRKKLKIRLNKVVMAYRSRVSHWSKKQKLTLDMV